MAPILLSGMSALKFSIAGVASRSLRVALHQLVESLKSNRGKPRLPVLLQQLIDRGSSRPTRLILAVLPSWITPVIASFLTSLLEFVGVLGGSDAMVGPVHTLLGLILQLHCDLGNHAVRGSAFHQLLHLDRGMSRLRMCQSTKFLVVSRLIKRTVVDED